MCCEATAIGPWGVRPQKHTPVYSAQLQHKATVCCEVMYVTRGCEGQLICASVSVDLCRVWLSSCVYGRAMGIATPTDAKV
jgi:hypothetical protein